METPAAETATPEPAPEQTPAQAIDGEIASLLGALPDSAPAQETAKPPATPAPEPSLLADPEPIRAAKPALDTAPTVKALAEQAGINIKDVTLTLDNGDGTAREIPYATVKKQMEAADTFDAERLSFEQTSQAQTNELIQARREFEQIVSMIPPEQWPAGLSEKVNQQQVASLEYEARMTMAAIPSWSDPVTMQADRELMGSWLKSWGYNESEIANIQDHRTLSMARYVSRMIKRVAELENSGPDHPQRPSKGTAKGRGNKVSNLKGQRDAGTITGDQAAAAYLKDIGI